MKIYHVDAFTDEFFKGNAAGVCIARNGDIDDGLKQKIASELGHSETAFVLIENGKMALRWFTPEQEVDLCGHATLAAAHILWEAGVVAPHERITFATKSGELGAAKRNDKIELNFPRLFVDDCSESGIINEAFGIRPTYTGKGRTRYLLEIEEAEQLRNIEPDFRLLARADRGGFMITCRSDRAGYDFLSRFFAPGSGIPEDPVTGSAHCYLAPYWGRKLNKNLMVGFQESKRTGVVECELAEGNRVTLRGKAVTFLEGEMQCDSRPA